MKIKDCSHNANIIYIINNIINIVNYHQQKVIITFVQSRWYRACKGNKKSKYENFSNHFLYLLNFLPQARKVTRTRFLIFVTERHQIDFFKIVLTRQQ